MVAPHPVDQVFSVAWFGLLALVWFLWGLTSPPPRTRVWMVLGAVASLALTCYFGYDLLLRGDESGAHVRNPVWFWGLLVVEVAAATLVVRHLRRGGHDRWVAFWVGMVATVHVFGLSFLLDYPAPAVLALILVVGLDALFDKPWFRTGETTTSGHVGLVMGACLLGFAIFAAVGHVGVTGG
ncbi:MAG TPA: hypothetical protein GX694_06755 [Actinomycetales bacterium]|nr:hypothetical protein [Actinomycetales bacterium]